MEAGASIQSGKHAHAQGGAVPRHQPRLRALHFSPRPTATVICCQIKRSYRACKYTCLVGKGAFLQALLNRQQGFRKACANLCEYSRIQEEEGSKQSSSRAQSQRVISGQAASSGGRHGKGTLILILKLICIPQPQMLPSDAATVLQVSHLLRQGARAGKRANVEARSVLRLRCASTLQDSKPPPGDL